MKIVKKKKHGHTICLKGIFEEFTLAMMPTRIGIPIRKDPNLARAGGIEPR